MSVKALKTALKIKGKKVGIGKKYRTWLIKGHISRMQHTRKQRGPAQLSTFPFQRQVATQELHNRTTESK